ncbi:putative microtubule binding protein [Paratrimastix pyriformis]|uniref:Autophagy-related protein n=1 Tax=Paratrimastix pyriformis TaxID=342808 RepID=A0ABQ8UZ53_9EUKA|nr:putative microtubule binding protein [Paratrimastix pyriformis]
MPSGHQSQFKQQKPFEIRKKEAEKMRRKYPDRIPVICERYFKSTSIPQIDKTKYLVPQDMTIGQFMYVIRKQIKLPQDTSIFLFCDDILPPSAELMSTVWEEHKADDGFLYLVYSAEGVFGQ